LSALCLTVGCSPVPRKYLREAVPNLTYSTLAATPQFYQDRLVVLGDVIVKEELRDGDLWLHVKNRPLNKEYRPELLSSPHDPEAGWYWIVVGKSQIFPSSYHHWADMTVVGRVTGLRRTGRPRWRIASRADNNDTIDPAVLGGVKNKETLQGYQVVHFQPFDPVHKRTEATIKGKDGKEFKVTKGAGNCGVVSQCRPGETRRRAGRQRIRGARLSFVGRGAGRLRWAMAVSLWMSCKSVGTSSA